MSNRPKILVIVGPTASGKSQLAWKLAKKYNGEIISADSRQVYLGMDIGTGKEKSPQHLVDVASPTRDYNVSHFVRDAKKAIADITARGKLPIIVGGTGFWIDALVYDWKLPDVKPDSKLRARLEKLPVEKLFVRLQRLDPQRARTIDRQNSRRLMRALEIAQSGTPSHPPPYRKGEVQEGVFWFGIKIPQPELDHRIMKRLKQWLEQGLVEEVRKLHARGVSWKRIDQLGLDYRTVARYVRGEIDYDTMVEQTYRAIRRYSKRQMTWFKRNRAINWIAAPSEVASQLRDWLFPSSRP